MAKTKIAIACQGGGSQTAFTAGALKALCDGRLRDEFEVVSVSGTSGGALCATLVWYSFRRGDQPIWQRLIDFWHDNTTQNPSERMINDAIIGWMRMVNRGILPMMAPDLRISTPAHVAGSRTAQGADPAVSQVGSGFNDRRTA
jgi:NTE family protein